MRPAAADEAAPRNFLRLQEGSAEAGAGFVPDMFTPSLLRGIRETGHPGVAR